MEKVNADQRECGRQIRELKGSEMIDWGCLGWLGKMEKVNADQRECGRQI